MEEMMGEADWVDVEVPDLYEVTSLPFSNNPPGGHQPQPFEPGRGLPPNETDQKLLTNLGGNKPVVETPTRTRRTKEKIQADLKAMVDEITGYGMFSQEEIDTVAKAEKIVDAEKAYENLKAQAAAVLAKEAKATQQANGHFLTPMDDSKSTSSPEPVGKGEIFVPDVTAKTGSQHVPPSLNSAPAARVSMPRLEDLEKITDIKASIRQDAGMPTPPSVSTSPVAPPVVAQMGFQHTAPPVSNPPPAGASASAEDLLNNLLKATGQS